MANFHFATFLCAFIHLISVSESATHALFPNQNLVVGQTLISQNQIFEMGFFSPGKSQNLFLGIWYKGTPGVCVWVANRNNPITDSQAVFLTIAENGAPVIISRAGNIIIWSANSSVLASNPVLQLLNSGNLVLIENKSKSFGWQSFDYPTDTWLPGMKMVDDIDAGLEKYLTSWRNSDDPSPGDYVFKIENQGLPEMVIYKGKMKTYRTGTWNGLTFTGTLPIRIFKPELIFREERLISISEPYDSSIISRVRMETSGIHQRYTMNARRDDWNHVFSLPVDSCDQYGQCGPNDNGGRGCLMWFGDLIDIREHPPADIKQNIYIRLPASELDPSADLEKEEKDKKWPRKLILISAGSGILVSALVNGAILLMTKRKRPEYAIDGKYSVKSDIFSLGVVLLEIVSGKKNRAFDHCDNYYSLLGHAWLLWKENRILELMDECLNDTFIESEVKRCIQVGLLCVQKFAEDRPVMSSVIFMLGTDGAILPKPKEPVFFTERSCSTVRNCTLQSKMSHKATMSITDLEAR
ncbi:g-type lectin s-receptor-like serine/threonine-protein kinase at4g27290 [Phtheirospermum japonicum]|uniref:G-type lectin s-receptor-like serine/threonine-protein kinase at4g27290 n=1 Tax=Phtheirospermum japonicum TaxID=374723 RepID=A0A830C3L0_9LAMI|nr:g-type lectin s-receptor-like serine/threonine-protein kinase at4g27290 [Phtheirospermum japonicum]